MDWKASLFAFSLTAALVACSDVRSTADQAQIRGGTVGVRGFRQLSAKLSAATGVSRTDPNVVATFESVRRRLSSDGSAEKISAASLLATATLAGEYCSRFILQESRRIPERRRALSAVDFQAGGSAFTPAVRKEVVGKFAMAFWERPAAATEERELLALIEHVVGSEPASVTRALLAACTAIASSLETLKI